MSAAPLAGRGIVVTRPAHQAASLAEGIRRDGGRPILFPVLEIRDAEDLQPLHDVMARLETFDLAIFISPNAVARAMALMTARRAWPPQLRAAAIGRGGVRELQRHGIQDVIAPECGFDSERLLDLPQLQQVAGLRIVIFRGDGGRELLGETLHARGARVTTVACYRRVRPAADPAPLLAAWGRGEVHAVVVTSSEGLRNLFAMVGAAGLPWLQHTAVVAPHPRIAAVARELGCTDVITSGAGDDGLLAALRHRLGAA